ncbi:MAG: hypothetical protein A2099_07225 [Planctomycetes bacterium GWF2_39_10]|nr:MAG: hypothetical protein A2099_07225 [Planctomycetes bacterium GWF2_39_10]
MPRIPTDKQGQKVNTQETSHLASQSVKDSNNKPKVSVIMNCLNGEKYLREAIDSVYTQTYKDWEIIFWDNASTDKSAEIAQSHDHRVRYFKSEETYLLGKARNLAFKQAKGEYIALLDVDDVWLPNKLEEQLKLFDKNSNLGMTFSNSIFFDETGDKYEMFRFVQPYKGNVFGNLLANNFISTETMIYKRAALERLDYIFDDEFTTVMDFDLSLRVAYYYEIDYVSEPLSKWRMHKESESHKRRSLIPPENFKMLEKLMENIPDIQESFSKEIKDFRKSIIYKYALLEWFNDNRGAAKNYLRPYLNDARFFITFVFATIFSYSQFEGLKSTAKKILSTICLKKA